MKTINPQEFLYSFIDNQSIELISIIGSGSYGVVYLGRYVYTNRYYAVKCMLDNTISRNEIEMHSTLSGHPNILSLEKVIKERNHVFVIMEYATQGDLFNSITQSRFSSEIIGKTKVIRHLFLQILEAVQHCHHNMVAHRDLKPENILLLSNHRVKLADFGLATSQIYSKEFHCGSSFYFSPECQGITPVNINHTKKAPYYDTYANDVWSLGIILVNLVSGRNPWKQANMKDSAFTAYVKHPHRFFRTILPGISKSLERILVRIFCLDPSKRITLPELKTMILGCRSFTFQPSTESVNENSIKSHYSFSKKSYHTTFDLEYSDSFENTMLAYVGDFIDDDESSDSDESSSAWLSHQLKESTSSNSLSSIKTDDPLTPRNGSPVSNFYICKLQQKQYELDYIKNYDY